MSINLNPLNNRGMSPLSSFNPLPSKGRAVEVFRGLGDRFWMQTIDGMFHRHGPLVFDLGLHGSFKEPGFYESLCSGYEFASDHLCEPIDLPFYKDLHKKLCAHFKGKENSTHMMADQAGHFRAKPVRCQAHIQSLGGMRDQYFLWNLSPLQGYPDDVCLEELNDFFTTFLNQKEIDPQSKQWMEEKRAFWLSQVGIGEKLSQLCPIAIQRVTDHEEFWARKVELLNDHIFQMCNFLDVPKFVSISIVNKVLRVDYIFSDTRKIEEIAEKLFDCYNEKIDVINRQLQNFCTEIDEAKLIDKKIEAIAELFQFLEWLHPFEDGQGRTDLVLMAKLLSEQGSNPAILNDPYTSTNSLFSEWKGDLLQGIEKWKAEASS